MKDFFRNIWWRYWDTVDEVMAERSVRNLLVFFTICLIPLTATLMGLLFLAGLVMVTVPYSGWIVLGLLILALPINTIHYFVTRGKDDAYDHIEYEIVDEEPITEEHFKNKIVDSDYDPQTYPREF